MPPKQQQQSSIKTRLTRQQSRRDGVARSKGVDSGGSPLFDDMTRKKITKKHVDKNKNKHSTIDTAKKDTDELLKTLVEPRTIEVHQEHLDEMDKQLRGFDLDYKYGPCVGLTRLERWERAASLGLDPPEEIKTLLLKHKKYQECLFHGRVI